MSAICIAFSALILLVGRQEEHLACRGDDHCLERGANELHMVPQHFLLHQNPEWFNLSIAGLPRLLWKKPVKKVSV